MHELAALLLALGAGGAHPRPAWLEENALRAVVVEAAAPAPLAMPLAPEEDLLPPACSGDFCQPKVALPGYRPRFTARTTRAGRTLQALDAAGLEPAATLAWWFVGTGLRFERTSATMDASANGGTVGLGYFQVVMSHRIDAFWDVARLDRGR